MKIRGRVGTEERFLGLLRALSELKKTGILVVTHLDVERRLYFEEGAIVAASSTAPEETFGGFLVERAIVDEPTVENAEKLQKEQAVLLGRALVELAAMSEDEVELALRLNVQKTIRDVTSQPDGDFELVDGRLPDKNKVRVSFDVGDLLDKSTERLTKRPAIRQRTAEPPKPAVETEEKQDLVSTMLFGGPERKQEPSPPPVPTRHARGRATPRTARVGSGQRPVESPRKPVLPIAAMVIAVLGLLAGGFWWLRGTSSPEAAEQSERAESASAIPEVPQAAAPTNGTHATNEQEAPAGREASPPRAQADAPPRMGAEKSLKDDPPKAARDAASPMRETASPSSRTSHDEAIERAPVSPSPAAAGVSKDVAVDVDRAPPPAVPPSSTPQPNVPTVSPAPDRRDAGDRNRETSEAAKNGEDSEPLPPPPFAAPAEELEAAPQPSPSKPAVKLGDLVGPGPDVIDPVVLELPNLKYPKEAKRQKIETIVRVRVLVDEQGTVLKAELEKPVGYGFDEEALKIAYKTRFIPATKNQVRVKFWTVLPLIYRLPR